MGVQFPTDRGGGVAVDTETSVSTSASLAVDSAYDQLNSALGGWFRGRRVLPEEAKDLAQETIVRTFVHLKRHGQQADDLKPLAFTIARNLLAERARRGNNVVVTLTDEIDIADTEPSPLDRYLETEERTAVSQAVASLQSRHRRVIELWMRGDTPADIARQLGIKRNAADALLHRARRRLATMLEGSRSAVGLLIGLLPVRLRLGFRRAAASVQAMDPGARFATAAAGLTAVGVATALSVSAVATQPTLDKPARSDAPASVAPAVPARPVTPSSAPPSTPVRTTSSNDRTPSQPGVKADLRTKNIDVSAGEGKMRSGKTGKRGADVWYDHGDSSQADAVIDPATSFTCASAPVCSLGGK
jgi:RNA polymerase sigma factor (sigma-70 family)